MEIGPTEKGLSRDPDQGIYPGSSMDEFVITPKSAYPIYLLIEARDVGVDPPNNVVISVHLNEQAAWDAIARLDPEGTRSLSVASYDPNEEGAA